MIRRPANRVATARVATLALRLLRRDWRAGELRVLAAALVVAVASICSVGVFTDRMDRALALGATELLAADLLVLSTDPIDDALAEHARQQRMATARTLTFRSVIVSGERLQLAEVKAAGRGYPLRGTLRVAPAPFADDRPAHGLPEPGTTWIEPRLMSALDVLVGDSIEVGEARLRVTAVLSYEPDRGGDLFSIAPRVLMNLADVGRTRLVRPASRVKHRMLFAGDEHSVRALRQWLAPRLGSNQQLQGVRDARPELRTALQRATQFLGLASLVAVLLAGAAIGVAARRHAARHLDTAAIMRCLGAPQSLVTRVYAIQVMALGVIASAAGCAGGYLAQAGLARLLGPALVSRLPAPSWMPLGWGLLVGIVVAAGFALPPVMRLKHVPPARVLRRDLGPASVRAVGAYGAGLATLAGLVYWQAGDPVLATYVLGGALLTVLILWLGARALVGALGGLRRRAGVAWRFGIANIARHPTGSAIQVVAFGLGIALLLLLTVVRGDLLSQWHGRLPPATPNYFLINIQPDEVADIGHFLAERGLDTAELYPMVRGRLTAIGSRAVSPEDYAQPRAQRLAARDFNLSWTEQLRDDNRLVAGRWWKPADHGRAYISAEEGIAETLGFGVGDELTFQVAGQAITAEVTSLRAVEWDSFRVNFFIVYPPGVIDALPATFITSFHLLPRQRLLLAALVRSFPSITVLDVDALLAKVREIMDRATLGVEYVFGFTLLAGFVVLMAATQATLDERRYETAIVRTLGASRKRVVAGLLAEFVLLGLLAGILAAFAASATGAIVATQVFDLDYRPNLWLWIAGPVGGGLGVGLAGLFGTRSVLNHPPLRTLREG